MSEPHIKQVVLTGGAAVEFTGGKKERKTPRSKKGRMEGGSTMAAVASSVHPMVPTSSSSVSIPFIDSVSSSSLPSSSSSIPSSIASLPAPIPVGLPTPRITGSALSQVSSRLLPPAVPHPPPIHPQLGGGADTKIIKVELKKRAQTKKVQLQPKKADAPVKGAKKAQTKKSRKITLGIKSLHKRMDRAKKMTRKVKEMPLEKLREQLIQKKLIKTTSKAPESVLRQIAADAQIVAGKAL